MGTRPNVTIWCYISQDHPHACGDKSFNYQPTAHIQGSSPRVWGQGCKSRPRWIPPGIIPTRVGTSKTDDHSGTPDVDHPHACGDKVFTMTSACTPSGSSPRVWGQACACRCVVCDTRIIPTRVGTSDKKRGSLSATGDHPHACGDKLPYLHK